VISQGKSWKLRAQIYTSLSSLKGAMANLEHLQPNIAVRGILPDARITVVSVKWFGSEAIELTY
jgi:hypothetical protein